MAQLLNIDGTNVEVMGYIWTKADQDLDSGRNLARIYGKKYIRP